MAAIGIATPVVSAPLDAAKARPWRAAVVYSLALGGLFYLSYGLSNWATSLRADVPSLAFGWERRIPFLAWTIVPYWSLNLFYLVSFFVCRSGAELDRHARRLVVAQLISVAAFLALPLRFDFERPETAGVFGSLFDALASFDRPFNQAPSLHLSIAVIVAARLSAHSGSRARILLYAWFGLIGVSTVTTFQHHVIDVVTGLWVGALCCATFPEYNANTTERNSSPRLSAVYFLGFVLLLAAAIGYGGWAWWLLWPGGSLLIVSMIYLTGRPELFRKHDGSIQPAMRWLLAPYLAAARLNSRVWTLGQLEVHHIADGVWLGRIPARGYRFASVVDLTAEFSAPPASRYRNIPVLDLTRPTPPQLKRAVAAIEEFRGSRPTLVCCALGYARSARAVAGWLVATGRAPSVENAEEMIRERRPGALPPTGRTIARTFVLAIRLITGVESRGFVSTAAQRIYVANHTSHADFVALWASLPPRSRWRTHPAAAADYWNRGAARRYLAEKVFRAVLVDRGLHTRDPLEPLRTALDEGKSLILFPEGTRSNGEELLPFKCGIYHLARQCPQAEIVPVWISNLHRVLPRGSFMPAPLLSSVTFGEPTRLTEGESKHDFLERLRRAVIATGESCADSSPY